MDWPPLSVSSVRVSLTVTTAHRKVCGLLARCSSTVSLINHPPGTSSKDNKSGSRRFDRCRSGSAIFIISQGTVGRQAVLWEVHPIKARWCGLSLMNPIRAILLGCFFCSFAARCRRSGVRCSCSTAAGKSRGRSVTAPDTPRYKYVIKTDLGGVVTLAKDQVKEILKRKPAEIEYEKKRHLFPDTVEGQWELAEWCEKNHLNEARKTHLRRIIELDPNHAAAQRAGYSKFDGHNGRLRMR